MNDRSGLWLLLIASFAFGPRMAAAQYFPSRESHRPLPNDPDMKAGQEMMADRLKELHELRQLQDQVQGLLQDKDFLNNIKQHLPEEDLRRLQEKVLRGDGLSGDDRWNKLLQQAVSQHKLDNRQIDVLRRWAERADKTRTNVSNEAALLNDRAPTVTPSSSSSSGPSGSTVPPSPTGPSGSSFWDRVQEQTSTWIGADMDGLAGDVADALIELGATEEGSPLAELLRNGKYAGFSEDELAEEAAGLSRYLPDAAEFLSEQRGVWDEVGSIFRAALPSSAPGLDRAPSMPSPPAEKGGNWGGGTIALLGLAVLMLMLWTMGGWSRWRTARGEPGEWRLGPWPVSPAAVSTRQDVVRAFEYLALLRLGLNAGTRHHWELAERLGEGGGSDPVRRRAAEQLAGFYEQARYAPEGEPLSPQKLAEARQALCLLAGVTAA